MSPLMKKKKKKAGELNAKSFLIGLIHMQIAHSMYN